MRFPLVGLLVCAALPLAAAEPVTSDAAVAAALAHSPLVAAARHRLDQARAQARAAGALPALRLELSPLLSDERGLDLEAALTQTLYDPTLAPAQQAARAAVGVGQAELAEVCAEVTAAARQAWCRLVAADRATQVRAQDVALAQAVRDAAARARDVGERPGVDVLRADLDLGLAEQALAAARDEADQLRAALASQLAVASGAALTTAGDLPAGGTPPDPADLAQLAAQRPRLVAARLQTEQRRRLVAGAKAQRGPTLGLSGWRADREQGVQLSLNLPLWDHGQIAGEVRAAEAAVREAEQQAAQAQRDVLLEVTQASTALTAAASRRAGFGEQVLARAERLAQLAAAGYQAGEGSQWEVLDARRRVTEARRQAVELDRAVAESVVALERAVGGPVPLTAALPTTAVPLPAAARGGFGPPAPGAVAVAPHPTGVQP